jgi:hypothetical protein
MSRYSVFDDTNFGGQQTWQLAARVDGHGRPIARTPEAYPYAHDFFVQERVGKNEEATSVVYSDRLLDFDYAKTRKLLVKHFKDTGIDEGGDRYDRRSAARIEGFLREWYGDPGLRVILVMKGCNVASGHPVWLFFIRPTLKPNLA